MLMEFSEEKFKALVHYICYKADRVDLGAVKLNKVLWFSELMSYVMFGKSMTGERYVKLDHGPVPVHITTAIDELQRSDKVRVRDATYFGYPKKEFIALKKPLLSLFTADEVSLIDDLVESICKEHTAKSISELSHTAAWDLAGYREEIPLYSVFCSGAEDITEEDLQWAAQSMAEECVG